MAGGSSMFPGAATGIIGTPVDRTGPGGQLIDPSTELAGLTATIVPALDDVIRGDGVGGWTVSALHSGLKLVRTFTVGVAVRDPVYQKADGTVGRADATSLATMPAIGVVTVIDAPLPGQCMIAVQEDFDGFSGLSPRKIYLVGTSPGSIVAEDDTGNPDYPSLVVESREVTQKIGIAASATILFINADLDFSTS